MRSMWPWSIYRSKRTQLPKLQAWGIERLGTCESIITRPNRTYRPVPVFVLEFGKVERLGSSGVLDTNSIESLCPASRFSSVL